MKRISQASEVRQVEGPGSLRFTKVSQDKIRYSRDRGGKEPEKCELDLMMDAAHPDYIGRWMISWSGPAKQMILGNRGVTRVKLRGCLPLGVTPI